MKSREYQIQLQLCKYLRLKYPKVLFNSDMAGVNISKTARKKLKPLRKQRGFPDLFIIEPRGSYVGLFLEIKAEGNSPFTQVGSLRSNKHIEEQAEYLKLLNERGYRALFCTGLDECIRVIDNYFKSDYKSFK